MNLPTPIHIPRGHELVKRYEPSLGYYSGDGAPDPEMREDTAGEYVRIDEVKAHLLKWLYEEHDKCSPDNRDEFSSGIRVALKATMHHINKLLFP